MKFLSENRIEIYLKRFRNVSKISQKSCYCGVIHKWNLTFRMDSEDVLLSMRVAAIVSSALRNR